MKSERDAAVWAIARFTAGATKERGRESAAIEEQDGLLVFFEPAGDRGAQLFGEDSGDF